MESNSEQRGETKIFKSKPGLEVRPLAGGTLVLDPSRRRVFRLSTDEARVFERIDGQKDVDQLAEALAPGAGSAPAESRNSVGRICRKLFKDYGIIQLLNHRGGGQVASDRFIRNPDVNLRDEDEDGGLLFNPDTDRIQLVSRTGLFIWKILDQSLTLDEITASLKDGFSDVPDQEVRGDVEDFIQQMVERGFIGVVETQRTDGKD
jgi:hypothetical protein